MSWHLKRSFWTATLDRYPTSFKEDRERSSSLSRRPVGPVRPFLRRPSTNGVTLQTVSGSTITNLAVCSIAENPRTRTRSRSSEALIPWKPPRRHSFSGDSTSPVSAIATKGHVLPLFTVPRVPRGRGISTMPFAMDIPDLSLRSNFVPPSIKDQASIATCTMCKYTIYSLECGHPAEDRLENGECSHFQRTGVPCDRENPAIRGHMSIKPEDRSGLCTKCRLRQREVAELEAMKRDEERAKKQSLAEAKEKEAALKKQHGDKLFREAAEDKARLGREQEEQQITEALKRSREEEEAARLQQEQDGLAEALKESCVVGSEDTVIKPKREQARADSVQLPSPPATPIRATPPLRSPPVETPAKPVDYSLPVGQQEYGAYTLGGRRQPVHESQKQKAAKYLISTPSTPSSPAPIARLGGTIQPNSPSPRHVHTLSSPAPAPTDLRANLRRTGGPRKSMPSQSDAGTNPELDAFLARRRTWERNDETSSNVSITPSESASNLGTRPSSSGASDLSGASNKYDDPLTRSMDEKRRRGSRKD